MWNCPHFRHPTDEQLGHVNIFFSNYYNLQSVYFESMVARARKEDIASVSYFEVWDESMNTRRNEPNKMAEVIGCSECTRIYTS